MKKEYLDYAGLKRVLKHLLPGARKIWHGTQVNWEALSETERDKYDQAEILPDEHFSGRTLIKSEGAWADVAGGHLSWKGTKAELEAALAAGELPEDTEVKVTDDYVAEDDYTSLFTGSFTNSPRAAYFRQGLYAGFDVVCPTKGLDLNITQLQVYWPNAATWKTFAVADLTYVIEPDRFIVKVPLTCFENVNNEQALGVRITGAITAKV